MPPLCKRGMNSPRLKPYPSTRGEWNKFSSVEEYPIYRGRCFFGTSTYEYYEKKSSGNEHPVSYAATPLQEGNKHPAAEAAPLCKRGMNSPRLKPYPSARGEWNKFSSVEEYPIYRGRCFFGTSNI
jgi:hypothetical protein